MSNINEEPLEPSRVAPEVHPLNDGIVEDAQQGDTFPGGGSAVTEDAGKVPFKDQVGCAAGRADAQVKGYAKVFAGEAFNNPAEVEYGRRRLAGEEPDARLLDSEYADECGLRGGVQLTASQEARREGEGGAAQGAVHAAGWLGRRGQADAKVKGWANVIAGEVEHNPNKVAYGEAKLAGERPEVEVINARAQAAHGQPHHPGFVDEAKGYAKKFAGETFDDDAEVAYGEAKIRGEV
ncbi:hypothetical protein Q8F55_007716 [Vanrija albida]|uniref:SMP domain-containing protein n=1 Tax=Vanrija albida TaxID=181172 RepID=A0ABR3PUB7_9TREE